ncbi:hypothetical protein [Paraburkholderia franconis]|nr:hypothetical protein [Paraburkholderia franconis]
MDTLRLLARAWGGTPLASSFLADAILLSAHLALASDLSGVFQPSRPA